MKRIFLFIAMFLLVEAHSQITHVASGAVSQGTATVTLALPTGIVSGQLLIAGISSKHQSVPTVTGWTKLGEASGGLGANGIDSGTVFSSVFYRIADGTETAPVFTTGNAAMGRIYSFSKGGNNNTYGITFTTGADNTTGTQFSIPGASDIGFVTGDKLMFCGTSTGNTYTYTSPSISVPGATVGGASLLLNTGSTQGNDLMAFFYHAPINSGSSTGAPTFTLTASGTTTNEPSGSGVIFRVREVATAGGRRVLVL